MLKEEKVKVLTKPISILLIEDNPGDILLLKEGLARVPHPSFHLATRESLESGLRRLQEGGIDVVLLDLGLPDSFGLDTLSSVLKEAPDLPIIVMTGHDDEEIALEALKKGAQDYLVKGDYDGKMILRAIRYAIERNQIEQKLRKSEERYRRLIQQNSDGIVIIDNEGFIRFVNPAAEELFAKKSQELVNDRFGFPVVKNEKTEIEISNNSHAKRIVELQASETDWEGKSVYLASLRDITKRKQAEEALRIERNRAEFFKDLLAHDINNSIIGIQFYVDKSLASQSLESKVRSYLEKCKFFSDEISSLISNVRTLSHLENGEQSLQTIDFAVSFLKNVRHLKAHFSHRKIQITHHFPEKRVFVKANDLIDSVIYNILTNAVKHNSSEVAEIQVTHSLTEDNKYWRIEFRDNGPGIVDSKKDKIFNRLERAQRNPSILGFGLGLTLVQSIVNGYGGRIWVEDRVKGDFSKGANFVLELPVAEPH